MTSPNPSYEEGNKWSLPVKMPNNNKTLGLSKMAVKMTKLAWLNPTI
jgi:hypothetical protein